MIEYTKEGWQIGTTPWPGSLEVTTKVVRPGCNRQGADFLQIVDVGGGNNGALVGKVRGLMLRDARPKALHVAPQQSTYQKKLPMLHENSSLTFFWQAAFSRRCDERQSG